MATILIVDDRPEDREVLVILLGYRGHRLLEATDGTEALALVRGMRPDLVITDILMPTTDGFEFVRQLREDVSIADTRVIFCTAHYHDREAYTLASKCGVAAVLTKPCDPEEVLSTVDVVLGTTPPDPVPPTQVFSRENLQLLNDELVRKADDLRRSNERLMALVEHCLQLGSERSPEQLLRGLCNAAREIIGARFALVGLVSEEKGHHLAASGMDTSISARLTQPDPRQGIIKSVIGKKGSQYVVNPDGDPVALGLPSTFPRIQLFLGVPILSPDRVYGWMGLIDKVGADAFTEEDERLACLLAAQVGRVYENRHLYDVLLSRTARLEREIADRNRAEEALRQSEERFRGAFEYTKVAMVLTNADHRFIRVNAAFSVLFGYSQSDLLQLGLIDIVHPDDLPANLARRESLLAGDSDYFQIEERYIHKAGHVVWGLTNVSIVRDSDGLPLLYVGQVQDITRRKQAEEALLAAQYRLESVVSSSPSVLFTLSHETFGLTWVSANIREMIGFTVEETLCQDWWKERIHPEDLKQVLAGNKELQIRGQIGREYRLQNREGHFRWFREELRLIREVGSEPIEIVGSWLDITEHRQLQDQLRQAQKLEVVGRLAGGVAHDFNNLLTVIVGYSELLANSLHPDDVLRNFTQEIRKAGNKGATLTHQLLAFSSKQLLVPEVIDPNNLLREMKRALIRLVGDRITLEFIEQPDVWTISVDSGQMEQVIMNLVSNARDAMPQGGKIRIETLNVRLDQTHASTHPDILAGEYVSIAIHDTGMGMDEATQAQIFEPFFTTKSPDKGTGLGLAVVHGFIRQSNGTVEVKSELGVGSTFKLYLPRSKETLRPATPLIGSTESGSSSETILLVEDEDGVRAYVRVVLETSGYTILEADNDEAAVQICRNHPEVIHALIADTTILNTSGLQLAERVLRIRPDVKILFLSGSSDDPLQSDSVLGTYHPVLQKPFTPGALVSKIQEVLQGR